MLCNRANDPPWDWPGSQASHYTPQDAACYYCGTDIGADLAIFWIGLEHDMYLHAACATDLCLRLLRDVHQVECKANATLRLEHDPIQRVPIAQPAEFVNP